MTGIISDRFKELMKKWVILTTKNGLTDESYKDITNHFTNLSKKRGLHFNELQLDIIRTVYLKQQKMYINMNDIGSRTTILIKNWYEYNDSLEVITRTDQTGIVQMELLIKRDGIDIKQVKGRNCQL